MSWAFIFSGLMVMGEFVEGTPGSLCGIVFSYLMVAALAFNAAGGMRYATGAYVMFNAVLTAVLGLILKLLLGEPVQTNLQDGKATMLVYLVGECAIFVAVLASRRFVRRKSLLQGLLTTANVQHIAIGCIAVGIGLPLLVRFLGLTSLQSTVSQLNNFVTLAILLSIYQQVRATDGRSAFTWPAVIASLYILFLGITSASKQELFTPFAAWALAAAAAGYRVSAKQLLLLGVGTSFAVYVLVPYSQHARLYRENGTGPVPIDKAIELLEHPLQVRQVVVQQSDEQLSTIFHWFNKSQGFYDRLNMVSVDDPLIYLTDQGQVAGLRNVWLYFPNIIPTFLYRDKPFLYFGNVYGREIHALGNEDFVTSVSFSPFGEAYHTGKWVGLMLVMPAILFLLFSIADSVAGKIEDSPWPLFYMLVYAHIAPEGALSSPVYMFSEGTFTLVFAALVSVYVTPLIGSLMIGPGRRPIAPVHFVLPNSRARRVVSPV